MEDIVQKALTKGVEMHVSGEFGRAQQLFSSVIKMQPKHAEANHKMGLLKVDIGNNLEALPYLQTALQADASVSQFWLSYIQALIKLNRTKEATRSLRLANENCGKSEEFTKLHQELNDPANENFVACCNDDEKLDAAKPNILDTVKLDKALRLAKKKTRVCETEAAKIIYKDILIKFPKNKSAINGLKILTDKSFGKAFRVQDPPQAQLKSLINLYSQGHFKSALDQVSQLLRHFPNSITLYNIQGASLDGLGFLDKAVNSYKCAISKKPGYSEAYNNMGSSLQKQGKLQKAIEAYKEALLIKPDYFEAYYNMGNALKVQGKLNEAKEAYNKTIYFKPDHAKAYNNMGAILRDQGKLEEALETFNKVLSFKPDYAEAYNNIGVTLKDQGKLNESMEAYTKALSLKPNYAEAHEGLSLGLIKSGRIKEGLDKYEWRWKTYKGLSIKRNFSLPLWNGRSCLKGRRILLWTEQGIGDTLNWSSCVSHVASQSGHCILECQEKLVPLLARSFPGVEVKPENRKLDNERNDFDFHLPMGSLYRHFIKEISENAKINAYLKPDPVRINFWRDRLNSLGRGPYVGISWKSSVVSPYRLQHYPPIYEWSPILTVPDVTFINLQYHDFEDDLANIKNKHGVKVHNFEDLDHYNNVDDVVALCSALDMVVATKVTPLILSSAVGTPTKIANWRQSIWNNLLTNPVSSSVDVFERDTGETWDNVFNLIAEDVFKLKNNSKKKNKS